MSQENFPKESYNFQPGMKIRILSGPFKKFRGEINEVDPATQKVKATVNFYGEKIYAEFGFAQIAADNHA